MNSWKLKTPVVLIIFNRADTLEKVFSAVRQAQPPKLFVISDGARSDKPGEAEECLRTREIINRVDWECEVFKNYSDINLGLRRRIGSTGLTWVFEQVEDAIILEDDCVPSPTFFRFCEELLERYRHDERVMTICGTNHLIDWKSNSQSYHFSYHFNCWGWASWRRVWQQYDVDMKQWLIPEVQDRIKDWIVDDKQFLGYRHAFDQVCNENRNTWAYQMAFLCMLESGFSVIPSKNQISNVGFGKTATNTSSIKDVRANMPVSPLSFPLQAPPAVGLDREYEQLRYRKLFDRSLGAKISRKLEWLKNTPV